VRLARFNVEQGGEAKRHFNGLPSPAAGMTLATFYPWTQTRFFEQNFADLPWPQIVPVGMVLIGVLLVSHVPYARFPKIGLRTRKGIVNTVVVLAGLFAALTVPRHFLFSLLLLYVSWGLVKSVLLGLLDRLPGGDPLLDEDDEDEDPEEPRALDYADLRPGMRPSQDETLPPSQEDRG